MHVKNKCCTASLKMKHNQERICDELTTQGWAVLDNFFDGRLIENLAYECQTQHQLGLLTEAGVGSLGHRTIEKSIRGDQIRWLEPGMSSSVDAFLGSIEELRHMFNQTLFLGLRESEHHFAFYPSGSFYQKHVDCFQNCDSRVMSSVLYLNPHWQAENGGALRLHLNGRHEDIAPVANRLVLFMSAQILHEVLPTTVERLSLTGWFRR